jgi:2-polyprenyl-3-methyl-5-hydroxy-6-metoxy-1,4-benzoquinol methylase
MTSIDQNKVEELAGKVVGDVAGALGLLMAYIGDQAGVYAAMDEAGKLSSEELAELTGMNARYLQEWLSANAIAGYIDYDPVLDKFELTPEQATIFSREGQPACMQGFFQAVVSQFETHEQAAATFKSGKGRPWNEQSPCCFCATDRFFRPGYAENLTGSWIPSLDGVEEKLKSGGKIADIACGHGSSTVLMAQTYPNSRVVGIDFHAPSIEAARKKAEDAGVKNVEFVVASAQDFSGSDFDFACIFDALHDMGDPVGAARHIKLALKPSGTFMLVEPLAGDTLSENMNPISQIFYSFSTTVCLPASLSQDVGYGLGAQAGEKRLNKVLAEGGFSHCRRATETPTNMVLEIRA